MRTILNGFWTLFLVISATFFLLRLAPGSPFDSEQVWPAEIQATILSQYGLDQPLPIQYFKWLGGVVQGDLKESFQYIGEPVSHIISQTFPTSALLGISALFVSLVLGVLLGALASVYKYTLLDRTILGFAFIGNCLPTYLIASILILIFSIYLGWFPPALWGDFPSMVLPIMTLSWRPTSLITQLTRTAMIQTLKEPFIQVARSKGLPEHRIILKHALKNSLVSVTALLGPMFANLVTGSFLVEIIFQIPGMGKYFVHAVLNRDYPLVMGLTLTYGLLFISAHLTTQLCSTMLDPRLRWMEAQ